MDTSEESLIRDAKAQWCVCCNANDAKYKCPKCLLKYCSVGCCQSHKTNGTCLKTATRISSSAMPVSSFKGTGHHGDPYERLKMCIKSSRLQGWIKRLDNCSVYEAARLYDDAMDDPEFVEYSQLIGKIRSNMTDTSDGEL